MRVFLFSLLLLLCAAGPFHYLRGGARARAERRARVEFLAGEAQRVRTLALEGFAAAVIGPADRPAASNEELRALARAAGVDPVVLEPVIGSLGAREEDSPRRRAVLALLHALAEVGGLEVESLRLAATPSTGPFELPVSTVEASLALLADPASAVELVERLLAGSERDPPADLVEATLGRCEEGDWHRGARGDGPPVRLSLKVDILAARARL
ncbi:MAG: hypothetical protein HY812_19785 [Planctomycetes bacterium]|nr:hypothetical protein [Planctomycetota bacterium]